MTDVERAWLAGIYEGEGTFYYDSASKYPTLRIKMIDRDIIQRVADFFGNVVESYEDNRKETYQKMYVAAIRGQPSIRIIGKIWEFLGKRRKKQVRDVIDQSEKPMYEAAFKQHVEQDVH